MLRRNRLHTSTWLALGCIFLLVVAAFDFTWTSNRASKRHEIYAISTPTVVEIRSKERTHSDTTRFTFKFYGVWQITVPAIATTLRPAVMDAILATNSITDRSYPASSIDLNRDDFNLDLLIDQNLYQFGPIEPVSGLRYVLANNRLYLQPDQVVPLINAGIQALTVPAELAQQQ